MTIKVSVEFQFNFTLFNLALSVFKIADENLTYSGGNDGEDIQQNDSFDDNVIITASDHEPDQHESGEGKYNTL